MLTHSPARLDEVEICLSALRLGEPIFAAQFRMAMPGSRCRMYSRLQATLIADDPA